MPESVTTGTLPRASLVTATPAVRCPPAVGSKTTLIVQLALGARVWPQVLVWLKSPALVPVMAMLAMFSVAFPLLLIEMVSGGLDVPTNRLLKTRLPGERLIAAALMPIPVSETVCGLPTALSEIMIAPVRVPVAVGVNVTRILQLDKAARLLPQSLV